MEIERLLARTEDESSFLVKWKGVAVLHAHWLSREDVLMDCPSSRITKVIPTLPVLDRDHDEWTAADGVSLHVREVYSGVILGERILARKMMPSLPEGDPYHYMPPALHAFYLPTAEGGEVKMAEAILVKWKGLSALESTWEWVDDETVKFIPPPPSPLAAEPKFPQSMILEHIHERIQNRLPIHVIDGESGGDGDELRNLIAIATAKKEEDPILLVTDSIAVLDEWDVRFRSTGRSSESIFVYHDVRGKAGREFLLKQLLLQGREDQGQGTFKPPSVILTTSNAWAGYTGGLQYLKQLPFRVIILDRTAGGGGTRGGAGGTTQHSVSLVTFAGAGNGPSQRVDNLLSVTALITDYIEKIRNIIIFDEEEVAKLPRSQLEKWKVELDCLSAPPYSSMVAVAVRGKLTQHIKVKKEAEDREDAERSRATRSLHQTGSAGSSSSKAKTFQSAYRVLGVRPNASREEIKRAFRNAIRRTHPDRGGSPGKTDEYQAILKAYRSICH